MLWWSKRGVLQEPKRVSEFTGSPAALAWPAFAPRRTQTCILGV